MFEDSLFASNSVSNPRRGWTALTSFFVQTLFIGVLVALPAAVHRSSAAHALGEYPGGATSTRTDFCSRTDPTQHATSGHKHGWWPNLCSLRAFRIT